MTSLRFISIFFRSSGDNADDTVGAMSATSGTGLRGDKMPFKPSSGPLVPLIVVDNKETLLELEPEPAGGDDDEEEAGKPAARREAEGGENWERREGSL